MKKIFVLALGAAIVLSSCGSYNAASGAYIGGQFGHVIGSAVGGITGGWRGSDWGSLIGTVGGAAAGAVIGSAIDKKQQHGDDRIVFEQRGDDRIVFDRGDDRIGMDNGYAAAPLQIRRAGIFEKQNDGVLTRGEECQVVFEIHNTTNQTVYDVRPLVEDVTGNKHVKISPNLRIESIAPHKAIRYTATIVADSKLKDGEIKVRVGVAQGDNEIASETRQFTVPTAKVTP